MFRRSLIRSLIAVLFVCILAGGVSFNAQSERRKPLPDEAHEEYGDAGIVL